MDEFKAEAQVLGPVLKAARAELGEERANCLILGALRAWCRERFEQIGARLPGSPKEKREAIEALDMTRMRENELELEFFKQEPEALEYNVTHCLYADLLRELGEPELGVVLACDNDFHLMAVCSPEVELTRTQTIMEGGSCCDIRWRIHTNPIPK